MITDGPGASIVVAKIAGNISHLVRDGGWEILPEPGGYRLVVQEQALTIGPDAIPALIAQVNNIVPLTACEIQGNGGSSDRLSIATVQAAFPIATDVEGCADRSHRMAFSG